MIADKEAKDARGGSGTTAIALPIAVLIAVIALVVLWNPGELLVREEVPPAESLVFGHPRLSPGLIELPVTNEAPEPVTIAQVLVDDAYWQFTMEPDTTLDRLEKSSIVLEYPWVEGEAHEIVVVTGTGTTFAHEIELAVATPVPDAGTFAVYALIGLLVGVVPIFAGLLWYPAIRRAGIGVEMGILAFTIGLLAFLVVESVEESLELAAEAPGPLGGPGLVLLGIAGALAVLLFVGDRLTPAHGGAPGRRRLVTAYLIAVGIGLHNLGEGLAIGAAYALGEVALGAFLVLGFTLHNVTEGPAIVSPLARSRAALKHLALLGLIGGGPTIIGAWIGGFAFSPVTGALLFALGAGAMLQVIYAVGLEVSKETAARHMKGTLAVGFFLGVAVMWGTGLLV